MKMGGNYFILAGVVGYLALFTLSASSNIIVFSFGLFFFGVSFIFLQSTLVSGVQDILPKRKGTAMSLASFNMFVGGAVGTSINAKIITAADTSIIYLVAAILILAVGLANWIFIRNTGSNTETAKI